MESERKTYVLKVRKKRGRVWVLFDEQHMMEGNPGETQGELVARWRDVHGPTGCLVAYEGTHAVADLTATMRRVRAANLEEEAEHTREESSMTPSPNFDDIPDMSEMSLAEQLLTISQLGRKALQEQADRYRAELRSAPDAEMQAAKQAAAERLRQLLVDATDEVSGFVIAPIGSKPGGEPEGRNLGPGSADELSESGPEPDEPRSQHSTSPAEPMEHMTHRESSMLPDEDEHLDDEASDDEGGLDEDGGPECPICKTHCQLEGACVHLVSSLSFAEEGGEWGGGDSGYKILRRFEASVRALCHLAEETDAAEEILPRLLPKRLHALLDEDFCDWNVGRCCDAHLIRLIEAHPKFVGSRCDQSDGMASSMWQTCVAEDGFDCTWDVEQQLAKDVLRIRWAIRNLKVIRWAIKD
jgi:hypothetical protein